MHRSIALLFVAVACVLFVGVLTMPLFGQSSVDQEYHANTAGGCTPADRHDQYEVYWRIGIGIGIATGILMVLIQLFRFMQRGVWALGFGHFWPVLAGIGISASLPLLILRWGADRGLLGLFCAELESENHPFHYAVFVGAFLGAYVFAALGHRFLWRERPVPMPKPKKSESDAKAAGGDSK